MISSAAANRRARSFQSRCARANSTPAFDAPAHSSGDDLSRSTARAWLSTTLRNTFRNRLEAQASRRNREQGAMVDGVTNAAAVPGPDARDTGRMVRAAVAALPAVGAQANDFKGP